MLLNRENEYQEYELKGDLIESSLSEIQISNSNFTQLKNIRLLVGISVSITINSIIVSEVYEDNDYNFI